MVSNKTPKYLTLYSKMPFSTQTGRMFANDVVTPSTTGKYLAKYGNNFNLHAKRLPENKAGATTNTFTPGKFLSFKCPLIFKLKRI